MNGVRVGKQRLQVVLRKHVIGAKDKERLKTSTERKRGLPIAANQLDRQITVTEPYKASLGANTYRPIDGGWLKLTVVIELFSRGWWTCGCVRR